MDLSWFILMNFWWFKWWKTVVSFLDDSLEHYDGTLPDLSEITRGINAGVKTSVFRGIGSRVVNDFSGKIKIGDNGEFGLEVRGEVFPVMEAVLLNM